MRFLTRFSCAILVLVGPVSGFTTPTTSRRISRQSLHQTANDKGVQLPEDFTPPEPQPLTITEKTDMMGFLGATAAFASRLGTGAFVLGWNVDTLFAEKEEEKKKYSLELGGPIAVRDSSTVLSQAPRPKQDLILYEYDGSPFCKLVRETINLLDLTVEYRPCPGARGGFSDELFERTGRRTVPCLIDPNTGAEMFESQEQIQYLLKTYGPPSDSFDAKALWPITFSPFALGTATAAALLRGMPASRPHDKARPENTKVEPLELWGYECSPFVKPVRETLCSMCLPHRLISCSRGSVNRDKMVEKTGRFQVPFLVDPNTGAELFEGPEIVEYLEKVYGKK